MDEPSSGFSAASRRHLLRRGLAIAAAAPALTPSALAGTNRVGVFVITRSAGTATDAGKDEFISSMGG